jgi:hypothetical protein
VETLNWDSYPRFSRVCTPERLITVG